MVDEDVESKEREIAWLANLLTSVSFVNELAT